MLPTLSHYQAAALLDCRRNKLSIAETSLDLGLTRQTVLLAPDGILLPEGSRLPWNAIEAIAEDENGCYIIKTHEVLKTPGICEAQKVQLFSELTERAYSLYPTPGAPTMLVSGLPMHRIKDTDPHKDTLEKIRAAKPVGNVLDTCTGLGYTAIEAAKTAATVTTIELDPAAIEICCLNPWSQPLFNSSNITQLIGDSFEEVANFPDGAFTRVIHDPPYFSLAGDLYSLDFYRELARVLTRNGRLFHYIGDPESKSGRSMTAGVIKRLEQAGFRHIERAPRAFGVVAYK